MFRLKIYNVLVNKQSGIEYRYHRRTDNAYGIRKICGWLYLLGLNILYYVFRMRNIGVIPGVQDNEKNKLPIHNSESLFGRLSVTDFVNELDKYDVVSFDIFDTLIFRPMDTPQAMFEYVGERLGFKSFKKVRIDCEREARIHDGEDEYREVNLDDIWTIISYSSGLSKSIGMQIEMDTEKFFCYANPFMLEVWNELRRRGKIIIVTTDMYLPRRCIEEILRNCDYYGYKTIYVSNEYACSKADGGLYKKLIEDTKINPNRIIHVGDNPHSDVKMAKRYGISVMPYPNVNRNMLLYRPYDMSPIIGSAYRGLVSNYLYNGLASFSMEYEYGYIYGGLFVVGYCHFIHEYYVSHNLDKLLFLSRDGETLIKVYQMIYPEDKVEYVYWSRKASTKLMASSDRHDYFRRFIYHKLNQQITISDALVSMELDGLKYELKDWKRIWEVYPYRSAGDKFIELNLDDELTTRNGYLLRRFIEGKWDLVMKTYAPQHRAARRYYSKVLSGCSNVAAVDIGWAGSGALSLNYLCNNVWDIKCNICGIIAGTNTIHNSEPYATESFIQSGKLVSYMYSSAHNRDLYKKHNPSKNFNVYWELLLSSPTPQFVGFSEVKNSYELMFGECDKNIEGIKEIQQGIVDFASQYISHFKNYPYMLNISGRDAYAPMLIAASKGERYLKAIAKRFNLRINVE